MPGKYHRFGRGIRRIRIYLFLKFLAHDFHAKDKRLKIKHKKFAKLALGDIVIELASWRAYSIVKIANPNEKKVRKLVLVRIYFDRSDVFGDNIDVVHREYRKRDILVLRDSMDE
ncbi:hypothetical protein MPRF_12310 [Mycolicibacterium parafortuitum]|uniref:Uncharacterized protein n=2 Tax=Mycolicibacterium parafortuitum TaxID=39692 RepID=A0A7I7TYT5_MYCPF|nr:hypothetical protein MPRF_12310 [Mycolicibacterium parafortuitum]